VPKQHVVKEGECITSIAEKYGFFWDSVWKDPDNKKLQNLRKDPNTLVPGDVVMIQDKRPKKVGAVTNESHTFRKKGIPAICRLQLYEGDEYRANQDFTLEIDSAHHTGKTNAEGVLEVYIPAKAKTGRLVIGPDESVYELNFGKLEPVSTVIGQKARLSNLGFDPGDLHGRAGKQFETALRAFQERFGLNESGQADKATQSKLLALHDEVSNLPEEEEIAYQEEVLVANDQEDYDY